MITDAKFAPNPTDYRRRKIINLLDCTQENKPLKVSKHKAEKPEEKI
jgi:hypothetical protein